MIGGKRVVPGSQVKVVGSWHGWYGAPGLYNEEQASGWKKVTDHVQAKDGKIFVQLWHLGRQAHSSFNSKRQLISASAIPVPDGGLTMNSKGEAVLYETPRALETDEVSKVVEDYRRSAELAKARGFDGVEIHAATGYWIDQFLQSVANKRTDKYAAVRGSHLQALHRRFKISHYY